MVLLVLLVGCEGPVISNRGSRAGDAGPGARTDAGAGVPPGVDGGPVPPGADGGGGIEPTDTEVEVPLDLDRPVDIMPRADLADVAARMPHVADAWLHGVLESADTMWYDQRSIVPGYQDSFGDNTTFPIGMRPNTIDPRLIVEGGHELVFAEIGRFRFPFGNPAGSTEEDLVAVDFWQAPRGEGGELLPVVWWEYEPNGNTHRVEWMFPEGTVLGEILMIVDQAGERWPFEIRVRVRAPERWTVDVFRPFPTAESFAAALERKRGERAEWESSSEIDALIAHLRNPATLEGARLSASAFEGAFPPIDGAEDVLPRLSDDTILRELLAETPFRSARGSVWKESGGLRTYAPTTDAPFQIVPRGYTGGFLAVDEETCETCHRDAGRPLTDWYFLVTAYGEMWGGDDSFTWHPFANGRFVDSGGSVVQFNTDNREMRSDFVSGGVLERYDPSVHTAPTWSELDRSWKGYTY